MSELINADAALRELLCGKKVERCYKSEWSDLTADDPIDVFFTSESFRLKPRTITLNGIEVPAPFETKEDGIFFILDDGYSCGYRTYAYEVDGDAANLFFGLWRTEEEIKQVVAALRSVFGKK